MKRSFTRKYVNLYKKKKNIIDTSKLLPRLHHLSSHLENSP